MSRYLNTHLPKYHEAITPPTTTLTTPLTTPQLHIHTPVAPTASHPAYARTCHAHVPGAFGLGEKYPTRSSRKMSDKNGSDRMMDARRRDSDRRMRGGYDKTTEVESFRDF